MNYELPSVDESSTNDKSNLKDIAIQINLEEQKLEESPLNSNLHQPIVVEDLIEKKLTKIDLEPSNFLIEDNENQVKHHIDED